MISELEKLGSIKVSDLRKLTAKVWFLDACTIENNWHKIKSVILPMRNFRVHPVVLDELKVWSKPGTWETSKKKKAWVETMWIVSFIESNCQANIDNLSYTTLEKQLRELEPLLTKTIAYNLVISKFDEIYNALSSNTINLDTFNKILTKKFEGPVASIFMEIYKKLGPEFEISNIERHKDNAVGSISNVLIRQINLIFNLTRIGKSLEDAMKIFMAKSKNWIDNDIKIVAHYLDSAISKGLKHFPGEDRDTIQLIRMHEDRLIIT